jgi:hypothetical protein
LITTGLDVQEEVTQGGGKMAAAPVMPQAPVSPVSARKNPFGVPATTFNRLQAPPPSAAASTKANREAGPFDKAFSCTSVVRLLCEWYLRVRKSS